MRAAAWYRGRDRTGYRFAEAGADILFLEAIEDVADIERLPNLFNAPLLINIVIGGKTPVQNRDALEQLGYGLVPMPTPHCKARCVACRRRWTCWANGQMDEDPAIVAPFGERQRLVGKPKYDELDARYRSDD
jgi:2-methylisocitrate lyase-like PEP mutase family enzyme